MSVVSEAAKMLRNSDVHSDVQQRIIQMFSKEELGDSWCPWQDAATKIQAKLKAVNWKPIEENTANAR